MSNVVLRGEAGKPIDPAVWEDAAAVVEATYRQQLLMPSPMECRTILAVPEGDRLTVWSGHQMPHRLRRELAALLGWSADRIRVVVPDTEGAFGSKSAAFPEFVTVAYLAVKFVLRGALRRRNRRSARVRQPRSHQKHPAALYDADAAESANPSADTTPSSASTTGRPPSAGLRRRSPAHRRRSVAVPQVRTWCRRHGSPRGGFRA
ncbi:molybdopterin cofactor-binding domain-containing protein [Streptomyces tubercidicus]